MEIRNLITFQTIVKEGTYTSTAVRLGYTQSTITSHIQALEEEVGGQLFNYEGRKLQLTALGQELIPLSEDLLSTHDQIKNMKNTHEIKGSLKVAAPESLTISKLGAVIREFSMKYPHVRLILTNGTCRQNQSELLSGRVDAALMVYPDLKLDKCIHHNLGKEEIVIVSSPDGPDDFRDYKNMGDQFYITNEDGCSYRSIFERYLIRSNMHKFQTMELWSIEAIKQTVMSGIGFAALPYMTVKDEIETGKLKEVKYSGELEPLYSHLLIKKKKWISPTVEAFKNLVLKEMQKAENDDTLQRTTL